jgi:LacI family transcriptional regulator
MAKVRSKDVAQRAGVSIATVSHVVNGTRFVSDETRQKVLDAIEALNYRPNAVARGLATNSTRKIGLVISEISNPFFTVAARGVEDEFLKQGYNIILCDTDEDPKREDNCLHLLATQQIDGLIISPTGVPSASLQAMAATGIPIVQLDRSSPDLALPLIGVNNEEGAYRATRYLIDLGHQRIACLINLDVISTQRDRLKGWERALREANLPVSDDLIVRADPHFYGIQSDSSGSLPLVSPVAEPKRAPSAYELLQDILKSPGRPSAIFVASNQLTLGTLYAFRTCGLRCPDDISLISFDDHDWAPIFSPPLTVVCQPAYRLGQAAAQLLMKMINGESAEVPAPMQVELIIRASCAAPSTDGRK